MAALDVCDEEHLERLLRVATCLAQCGYGAQVGQLAGTARAFYCDAQVWGAQVHHRGKRGRRTHLMHAARTGCTSRVQYLLDRGAAPDAVTDRGWTALMLAIMKGHLETVRFLVMRGSANVNAARTTDGLTALMLASEMGHLEIVRFLVERGGANGNAAKTTNGTTALLRASQFGHLEIARFLVERGGANVNAARTTDGFTALMVASENGHLEIVRCLVELWGANVNAARTTEGFTALMWASKNGHLETVRTLLQHGADKRAASSAGRTAHFYAAAHPLVLAALA